MSKRGNRRTCASGKVRYRDHAQAIKALHKLQNVSTRERLQTRDYACSACGGVHLTASRADAWT